MTLTSGILHPLLLPLPPQPVLPLQPVVQPVVPPVLPDQLRHLPVVVQLPHFNVVQLIYGYSL